MTKKTRMKRTTIVDPASERMYQQKRPRLHGAFLFDEGLHKVPGTGVEPAQEFSPTSPSMCRWGLVSLLLTRVNDRLEKDLRSVSGLAPELGFDCFRTVSSAKCGAKFPCSCGPS